MELQYEDTKLEYAQKVADFSDRGSSRSKGFVIKEILGRYLPANEERYLPRKGKSSITSKLK